MNESQQTLPRAASDDEIDLRELFRVLWVGKWLIGSISFTATVIAVIFALMLPNIYRAEALLAPNNQKAAGGLSALAAQYSGLASLAGIDVSNGSLDRTTFGIEVLKSRKFISGFIERHDLLVPLMAARGWDSQTGEPEIDPDDYDSASGTWVRDVRPPKQVEPSLQEAYKAFLEKLSVTRDIKSGLVRVSIEHYSPITAKQWVDWLIADLNVSIMREDVLEAEQAIAYLEKQIQSTPLADLRGVFSRLIEEQTKTILLAEVTEEYLFKTVDPAIVPEEKMKPNRRLIILMSLIIGGFLGGALIVVLNAVRS